MNTVLCKCVYNTKKYCMNWDGRGNPRDLQEEIILAMDNHCPPNKKECSFLVTPKPSPALKAK